ncbi:NAD-dependent epimerase/dehydratase family protein [Hymenobacter busanensis]|uniref:NAD-dependent epimerase/dehydratase family protein n=1 Tax=Hymenobacter busanensis TaxID=2607656 RepID=A0A7L4ZUX6_9BACT|nr:NAD-dependent epimerase/dehydratase family protein [Hymenobacter busanensis]KAA9339250.1 NAD-dependent epimerase/dehydratase family protein [Hymenobacter busanensis]QHJ06988.1 NAD-dependent epimerase/dehydratase family protein [Hymenobacter busanensis]
MFETLPVQVGNRIVREDMETIYRNLTEQEIAKLRDSTILLTGCGGFLGYYFMHFFAHYAEELQIKRIIALENFLTGTKDWLSNLVASNPAVIKLHEFNVITDSVADVPGAEDADLVIHMASIASPTFYRIYPLETVDANITGLRRLLDFYADKQLRGFLFFSSSEIYGDPFPEFIPTPETYRGNVATIGPRACYDEAKRFGETLCYLFAQKYNLPIGIARPFNNYGPGMNINDKRLPADFAKAVVEGRDLEILSDGTPTRTFCYISDAITGYMKVLLHGQFEVFNIGMDQPELSVRSFAELFTQAGRDIFDYQGTIFFQVSADQEYLTDNPNRRCPDLTKARTLLGYAPAVPVADGIRRYLKFLHLTNGQLA